MIASYRRPIRPARRQQTPGPSFAAGRQPLIRFIQLCFAKRIVLHTRQHRASAQDRRQPEPFSSGIMWIYFQSWSCTAVLPDRQIDRTELIAYRFIATHTRCRRCNKSFGVTNRKLAHSVWLRFSPRPKVPRRQHVDGELVTGPVPPAASPLR